MRYIVYGAGAIGGGIGGLLAASGSDVVLVARGAHLDVLQSSGLELRSPAGTRRLTVPAVGRVGEAEPTAGDVVLLSVKGQDTAAALDDLVRMGRPDLAVVCAQNGVESERQALRRFARVYGMCVYMPATHLSPGVVELRADPVPGVLDLGRYPSGVDETAVAVAADLRRAGFACEAQPAIMGRKYRKLLANLSNTLDAAVGPEGRGSWLVEAARAEAMACFAAAGIPLASETEDSERRGLLDGGSGMRGRTEGPSSSWQSLARGTGTLEADYLNGEIVLLGRQHGVPAPVNEALQRMANEFARQRRPPGSITDQEAAELVSHAR